MAIEGPARLTTHVLDTARGCPAAGVGISLYAIDPADATARHLLKRDRTNSDGRCDTPLLSDRNAAPGRYEIVFEAGRYFDDAGYDLPDPKFLDDVVIRFAIATATHTHVPLLLSPFGYSTYRGS